MESHPDAAERVRTDGNIEPRPAEAVALERERLAAERARAREAAEAAGADETGGTAEVSPAPAATPAPEAAANVPVGEAEGR